MNKKVKSILGSILVIGVAAAMLTVGTQSYFSDIETGTGSIEAGELDLTLNGRNGEVVQVVKITDMKPCYWFEVEKKLRIKGGNPADLWLHLYGFECSGGKLTEPEKAEQQELYNGEEKCDIHKYIAYDLKVGWDKNGNGEVDKDEWELIISPWNEIKLAYLECIWIPLAFDVPSGVTVYVIQSFHMQAEVTNWAQKDTCVFNEEFLAQQVEASDPENAMKYWGNESQLLLENKDSQWNIIWGNGRYGVLFFNNSGPKFYYQFKAQGLNPDTDYSLIYYADPWPGNNPGAFIGEFTTDASGNIALTAGSVDLNMDLTDAKIWLVLSDDYDPITCSMTNWQPDEYLFEHHLISYDDTDV
ncbi:hypothetical protein B6U81_03565 [Thermoplasmatales archaeon ex4484_30]|nr:MAG: hypothetical protein B6U81_03565 [Thermoplasmatales archaeon ex4484_30]